MHLGDFLHVYQWIILNHAIVYDETIGCCIRYGKKFVAFF